MSESTDRPKWIGDGSEGGTLRVAAGEGTSADIAFASASRGTPFSIRLDGGPAASHYEVRVARLSEGASLGAGLVAAEGFRPGWNTRGCFFNGNLTDGGAGLLIGFGDRIEEGDVVGVFCTPDVGEDDARFRILFYHNGRCLGAGFAVDGGPETFYPCLHLSGTASVSFSTPPPPAVREREPRGRDPGDPYGGDWAIERACAGPRDLPTAGRTSRYRVRLEKADAPSPSSAVQYDLVFKISNRLWTSFAVVGKTGEFDRVEFTGHCASTMMMPGPDDREMERLVSSALRRDGGLNKLRLSEGGRLTLSGPTEEFVCSRFVETFEPVRVPAKGR